MLTLFVSRERIDLANLDIANGQCVNSSIPQNVTFGEQGAVLDSGKSSAVGLGGWVVHWGVGLSVMVGGLLVLV